MRMRVKRLRQLFTNELHQATWPSVFLLTSPVTRQKQVKVNIVVLTCTSLLQVYFLRELWRLFTPLRFNFIVFYVDLIS